MTSPLGRCEPKPRRSHWHYHGPKAREKFPLHSRSACKAPRAARLPQAHRVISSALYNGPLVKAKTKSLIASYQAKIESGKFYEFTGPLYDQSGTLRVKAGVKMQVLTGGTNSLYGMNWLVKGVIGSPTG